MTGDELIRRLRKLAKARGIELTFVPNRGKGSHGLIRLGTRRTVIKDRKAEIGKGLLEHDLIRQDQ